MNEAILYRILIATIYAGLVLAIFDPTSSRATASAAAQPAKSAPSLTTDQALGSSANDAHLPS
jgi:hypothetical protein